MASADGAGPTTQGMATTTIKMKRSSGDAAAKVKTDRAF
jgi:hypothetical protein